MMKNNIWFKLYWTSIMATTIFLGSDPSLPLHAHGTHTLMQWFTDLLVSGSCTWT